MKSIKVKNARTAVKVAKSLIRDFDKEHVVGIYLNAENDIKKAEIIGIGTLTASLIHPREVYKTAIRISAAGIVLLHNHPTGGVEPSKDDIKITKQLEKAGDFLNIPLLDHIILCQRNNYYSFRANKKIGKEVKKHAKLVREYFDYNWK